MRVEMDAKGAAKPALRLIVGVSILLVFGLAGNRLHARYSIPLPGAVVGLVLLAGALAIARRISASRMKWFAESVAPASRVLLNHLGLLFVPAGCAVVTEADVLRRNWIPIVTALVVSTTLGLAVCGWIMHRFVSGQEE